MGFVCFYKNYLRSKLKKSEILEFGCLFSFLDFVLSQARYPTYPKSHNLLTEKRLFFSDLVEPIRTLSVCLLNFPSFYLRFMLVIKQFRYRNLSFKALHNQVKFMLRKWSLAATFIIIVGENTAGVNEQIIIRFVKIRLGFARIAQNKLIARLG